MSASPSESAPRALTCPRIELICPGCRRIHEHPADDRGGETTCPECAHRSRAPETVPVIYVAWEDRSRIGRLRALTETVRTAFLAPKTFFQRMPILGGWLSPITYAIVVGGAALLLASVWVFSLLIPAYIPGRELTLSACVGSTALAGLEALTLVILYAGLVHLAVILLGGASPRMQTTVRVVAYACSALLLAAIPYIGPPLALLWTGVLVVVGLREAQELSTGKAFLATLSPVLLAFIFTAGPCRPPTQT